MHYVNKGNNKITELQKRT